ncbi:hypothetical protein F0L74_14820 [Chitinophaga agrisoli]|uniref:Uncharacterized protein n=1 Tax=Chitinophaga agrisoli TaxID=2607653 RepID=A0A5B2W0E2_9BACT|nr:hypothetical protein [Chitinophaga agrisoli]KAA2243749.1 hypothetical protein F0L74_14820 [Chitinophaga agrisoli]
MITLTILSVSFLTAISCKIKKVKSPDAVRLLWYVHLVLLFFAIICLLLNANGYGFKGAYTERVFFSLYAGSGVILYGLTPKEVTGKWVYLVCFFGFPFVLLFGLLLPPLRILTIMAGVALLYDGDFTRYPIDNDYALQTREQGILSRYPTYSLIEDKYWFFEKITPDVIHQRSAPMALQMDKKAEDSVHVSLQVFDRAKTRFDTTLYLIQ